MRRPNAANRWVSVLADVLEKACGCASKKAKAKEDSIREAEQTRRLTIERHPSPRFAFQTLTHHFFMLLTPVGL
jgi:hypothetical protein